MRQLRKTKQDKASHLFTVVRISLFSSPLFFITVVSHVQKFVSEGVSYCNAKCQKDNWNEHRNNCSRVYVQVQKQMENIKLNSDVKVEPALYPSGRSTLPTTPGIFSEVSGTGSIQILWCPGSINSIFLNNLTDSSLTIAERECLAQFSDRSSQGAIRFRDFSDLAPSLRFLVCCGPLPQLNIVQQCVNEAVISCNGTFHQLRFPVVGFTALEWAAKKGHVDIVK